MHPKQGQLVAAVAVGGTRGECCRGEESTVLPLAASEPAEFERGGDEHDDGRAWHCSGDQDDEGLLQDERSRDGDQDGVGAVQRQCDPGVELERVLEAGGVGGG